MAGGTDSRRTDPTPADRPAGVRLLDERRRAEIAVVGVMVLWAANFIVVKDILAVLPPVGFTFLRYFLASLALLGILRWSEGAIRLPRPDTGRILLLGGLGFGLSFICDPHGCASLKNCGACGLERAADFLHCSRR